MRDRETERVSATERESVWCVCALEGREREIAQESARACVRETCAADPDLWCVCVCARACVNAWLISLSRSLPDRRVARNLVRSPRFLLVNHLNLLPPRPPPPLSLSPLSLSLSLEHDPEMYSLLKQESQRQVSRKVTEGDGEGGGGGWITCGAHAWPATWSPCLRWLRARHFLNDRCICAHHSAPASN